MDKINSNDSPAWISIHKIVQRLPLSVHINFDEWLPLFRDTKHQKQANNQSLYHADDMDIASHI